MPTALLLFALSQLDGFSMWVDAQGVVRVAATSQAPASATPLEGGSYSVIDGDGRPLVLSDGGVRADDSRWWRGRFEQARVAAQASLALERAAERDIQQAQSEVCVTATATATARVQVIAPSRNREPRVAVAESTAESTERRCEPGKATSAMVTALQLRRTEREQAERALRRLEQEAMAARVPLRDWR